MNRQKIRVIALAAVLMGAGAYVWAQRAATTVKPAHTSNAAVKKPANVTQPVKTPVAAPNTRNAAAAASTPAAARTPASSPAATADARSAARAADARLASKVNAKTAATPVAATSAAAALAPAAPLVSWQDTLQKGSYLAEKLRPRLPEGTDALAASGGFRDLQQFVAAAIAAHNLTLDFPELKRRVLTDGKGLAAAIDAMKKVASATIEEQRAEYEARGLIQEAQRQPAPAAKAAVSKADSSGDQPKKPVRAKSGA